MDNSAIYEALRAELVDAGCGLEAHVPMNQAMVELLNPYGRDNKEKGNWIDANSEKAEVLYFVGCTAALTSDIQKEKGNWIDQLSFKVKDANSEKAEVLYFVRCTAALTSDIQKVLITFHGW